VAAWDWRVVTSWLYFENTRLEGNKELVRVMEHKAFSEKNVDAAMKVAR
jgi:hypothetical protein